jgi:hypothetical protein
MRKPLLTTASVTILFSGLLALLAYADNTTITTDNNQRCISADGLPNHSTGQFPNSGNPHTIATQNIHYCFPLKPSKGSRPKKQNGSIGVALNGITIRPGTADYWDASSRRGHSRDRSSGWNLEGLGSREALGMDNNNAHVDNTGLYHYHGIPEVLVHDPAHAPVDGKHNSLIGYAADGFEIHHLDAETSSYPLKIGKRPSGPGGKYDGVYNEDWEYVAESGSLDQCNGGQLNGKFVYFATDDYPFFPRCLWGQASDDFGMKRGGNTDNSRPSGSQNSHIGEQQKKPHQQDHTKANRRKPPVEALSACIGKTSNAACSFSLRDRNISGSCRLVPSEEMACVPNGRH